MTEQFQYAKFVFDLASPMMKLTTSSQMASGALGLVGEAGEVADIIKKVLFQGKIMDSTVRQKLIEELGDVLFYLTFLSSVLGTDIDEVREANVQKLIQRYPEGFSVEASENRG